MFVSFVLIIMGSFPSPIKEPQIRALKTLLDTCGLKVKTHYLGQFWEEAAILPVLFLAPNCKVQSGIIFPFFFVAILLAVIACLKNSSPEDVVALNNKY